MPVNPKNKICEKCEHHFNAGNTPPGECRRYPPEIRVGTNDRFPKVDSKTYWCGEYLENK